MSFLLSNGARPNASKIVVVIRDGESSNPDKTKQEAALLKQVPGIKVFAIGIGRQIVSDELHDISSPGQLIFTVDNFNVLNTIEKTLKDAACSGGTGK